MDKNWGAFVIYVDIDFESPLVSVFFFISFSRMPSNDLFMNWKPDDYLGIKKEGWPSSYRVSIGKNLCVPIIWA